MKILSHRGYWKNNSERNNIEAFARSFKLGFGTETDIRDHQKDLYISHDMALGDEMKLDSLLGLLKDKSLPLAINIKCDGLAHLLRTKMEKADINNWFAFDMSVPDMKDHINNGNPIFTRMSEIETTPVLLDKAKGVWLDAFEFQWFSRDTIKRLLNENKQVCVVSSELHGRDYHEVWDMIAPISDEPGLMICTDHPELARDFFKG